MVSNRTRSNKSITNKITYLDSKTSNLQKRTNDPHLSTDAVTGENIAPDSITPEAFASGAVTDQAVARGAVGGENLGVVNELSSDGNLRVSLPGYMMLDGAGYPAPPPGVEYPLVQGANKEVVQGQTTYTATIDPMWTFGLPSVTLSTGGVEQSSGWATGFTPAPGMSVKVAWDGVGWFILGSSSSTIPFPNQIALTLQNDWTTYDANWAPAKVTKSSENIVHLSGLIKGAGPGTVVAGTVILTLPDGFRPDYDMIFPINNSDTTKQLLVRKTGDVEVYGATYGTSSYVSLANIRFPAAGIAAWSRFGIDSGFVFANSWKSWQFDETWGNSAGGGAVTMTAETSGGPAVSPNAWEKLVVTTASTSSIILANTGSASNHILEGVEYTAKLWVFSNAAGQIVCDLVFRDVGSAAVQDTANFTTTVAANTWTQVELPPEIAPAGSYRVEIRAFITGVNPVGRILGMSAVELYETASGKTAKNDSGPLRIWQEPVSGQIFCQGVVTGGSVASTITTTLPAAFRPNTENIYYTVDGSNAVSEWRVTASTSASPDTIRHNSGTNARTPIIATWRPATGSNLTWITPGYSGGWVHYGAPYSTHQYAKSPGGVVYVKGLIKNGTIPAAPFAFPAGYRCLAPTVSAGNLYGVISAGARGRVDNRADGNLVIQTGNNGWVSLEDISFIAEW
jgi:hypothetical protein